LSIDDWILIIGKSTALELPQIMGTSEATIFNTQYSILNGLTATLPNIGLGTAAVLIFAGCLTYVLLRGVGRLMIGTLMLAASSLLGFLTWQNAPAISLAVFNRSVGAVTTGLPIVVFVASFVLIRLCLKWIANPFGSGEKNPPMKDRRGLSAFRFAMLLGFALIPTLLLMVIAMGVIHHTGTIDELRQQANPESTGGKTYAQQLKDSIEAIIPRRILYAIDPFAEGSRLALAKWVARDATGPELEPAIDPETGKVIPRAIIVEDAELERLAREQKFGTLLRHPAITRALEDPEVRRLVDDLKN